MVERPFFITGYPRSRHAWLAVLMTFGRTHCFFDRSGDVRQLCARMREVLGANGQAGHADPCNALKAQEFAGVFPQARWLIVERERAEAMRASQAALGAGSAGIFDAIEAGLEWLKVHARTRTVAFEDLDNLSIMRELADWLSPGFTISDERWALMSKLQIQVHPRLVQQVLTQAAAQ